MARGGNKPVDIPSNVKVNLKDGKINVEGPAGKLNADIDARIKVEIKDNKVILTRDSNEEIIKAVHGTMRALILNMITGVTTPFIKVLQIEGVGYKALVQGNKLSLQLGFTHPVEINLPDGISASVEKQTMITLKSVNKEVLGNFAANIRKIRKADPYKAKGVKYLNEHIRRKVGKTATGTATVGGK